MGFPMDDIARYFNADIPEGVESTRPELWICGHTHYNVDFIFGETRILSNQGGYPHETFAERRGTAPACYATRPRRP